MFSSIDEFIRISKNIITIFKLKIKLSITKQAQNQILIFAKFLSYIQNLFVSRC